MKSYIPDNGLANHEIQEDNIDDGIMIVDDSKFSRNILRDILVKENFNVIAEAKNGLEAIELTKEKKPKYIFMDVEMPMLDGLGAIPLILNIDPNIHIIMCTAMGQKNIIVEAARAGAKDYVLKPYKKENIIRVLSVIIESHQENEKKKLKEAEQNTEQKPNAIDDVYEDVTEGVEIVADELETIQESFIAEMAITIEEEDISKDSEVSVTLEEELDITEVEESISFDDFLKGIEVVETYTSDDVQDEFDVVETDTTGDVLEEFNTIKFDDKEDVLNEFDTEETDDKDDVLNEFDTEETDDKDDVLSEFDTEETDDKEDESEEIDAVETEAIEDVLAALDAVDNDDIVDVLGAIAAEDDYVQACQEAYHKIDLEAKDGEEQAIEFDEAAEEVRKSLEADAVLDIEEVLEAFEATNTEDNEDVLDAFMADNAENIEEELLEDFGTDIAEDNEEVLEAFKVDVTGDNVKVLEAIETNATGDNREVQEAFQEAEAENTRVVLEVLGIVENEDNGEVLEAIEVADTEDINEVLEVDTENIEDILVALEAVDTGEDVEILEAYDEDETTDNGETNDTVTGARKILHLEELPTLDNEATITADYYMISYLWENRFDVRQEIVTTTKPVDKRISFQKIAFGTSCDKYISREEDSNVIMMTGMINAYLSMDNRLQQEDNNFDKQLSTYTDGIRLLSTKLLEEDANDRLDFTMSDFLKLSGNTKPNKVNINKSILTTTISQLVQGKSERLCSRIN